jgi:hypothetical protein
MNGPKIVCAGCGEETAMMKPVCDRCMQGGAPDESGEKDLMDKALNLVGANVIPLSAADRLPFVTALATVLVLLIRDTGGDEFARGFLGGAVKSLNKPKEISFRLPH